ncbi:predicted protein [Nematostella vectensis]|uniref:Sugar phosphate transporter domain-containing protein n=1 Tax=Nematostella vectensis TaxID=45351 RepID=A7SEN2_NEMVE|nr:solute carrier family 35 member E2A [Nematostella vectensis]EDO37817.1 predicted protein [Nematostella vectensis]|eukprot:XP_001629880.1 predicted protein [Nematostella vectensis]
MKMAPIHPPGTLKNVDIEVPHHHRNFDIEKTDTYIRKTAVIALWYLFSFGTLMSNKYILSNLNGDAGVLGEAQMMASAVFGAFKLYLPCCLFKHHHHPDAPRLHFFRNMAILGWMRFATVVCSLISLKYVAVSFTETVKSSAPIFTALFSWIMIGERSSLPVYLSLIPVMGGLALCTANELSFNVIGFTSALMNNLMDCVQNVFSKKLLSNEQSSYSAPELQFYTSAASLVVQFPFWFFFMDIQVKLQSMDYLMMFMLVFNGFLFYMQSLTAYALMSLISPVTFSVSNTVKRAVLIWISVLMFGNEVSALSALGTMIVTCGVFLYQRAKRQEAEQMAAEKGTMHVQQTV